jgi:hypothetical protein
LKTGGMLSLQPGIDVNFGNYEYLNLVYLDQTRQNPDFYDYLMDNSPALRKYISREIIKNPGTTPEEIIDRILEERAQDQFKITSVTFGLPLFYMIKDLGINIGLYLFIPVNQPDYMSGKAVFYFNAGLSYNFDLN